MRRGSKLDYRIMHLTRHTDYALRLLISLARHQDERRSIADVAEEQAISRTHLMKVANRLVRGGFIEAVRGRGGGITLAQPATAINIGAVVQHMEASAPLVDCEACRLTDICGLPGVLAGARVAFMKHLSGSTLADILT